MSDDLTAFLLARIAEDEAAARAAEGAAPSPWRHVGKGNIQGAVVHETLPDGRDFAYPVAVTDTEGGSNAPSEPVAEHVALHDPAHVLADCAAKQRIIASVDEAPYGSGDPESADIGWREHGELVLRLLAQPYAEHPDFKPEWRLS